MENKIKELVNKVEKIRELNAFIFDECEKQKKLIMDLIDENDELKDENKELKNKIEFLNDELEKEGE
jgi:uncharacterized coiled-coil DUF342 family protein